LRKIKVDGDVFIHIMYRIFNYRYLQNITDWL